MRHVISIVAICCVFALVAAAASIDGKWVSESTMQRKGGEGMKITSTFDLKSEGKKLSGTITSTGPGGRERKAEIKDGKINGDKFSFTVVQQMGEQSFTIEY